MPRVFYLTLFIVSISTAQDSITRPVLDSIILNSSEYNNYVNTVYRFALFGQNPYSMAPKNLYEYGIDRRYEELQSFISRKKIIADSLNLSMENQKEILLNRFPELDKDSLKNEFLFQLYKQVSDSIYYHLRRL